MNLERVLYLNKNLSRIELLYDLSHELTHYTLKDLDNPYQKDFSAVRFVRNGIEGRGGELAAFMMECKIAWELEALEKAPRHELCERFRIKGKKDRFYKQKALEAFYAVGSDYEKLRVLEKVFPHLSHKASVFRSSLLGVSYPLALLKEFATIRKFACANNLRKAGLLKKRKFGSKKHWLKKEQERLLQYHKKYCLSF